MMAARLAQSLLAVPILGGLAVPPAASAAEPVEVAALVLSEPNLRPGQEQIAQVTLRNNSASPITAGVRLVMRTADGRRVGRAAQRTVQLPAYDEQRALFRLKPPRRGGEYQVHLELYTADFRRRLSAQEPGFYALFSVTGPGLARVAPAPPPEAPTSPIAPRVGREGETFAAPGGLTFEAADLLWENVDVAPTGFLVGDTGRIRAELRNVGGDIARRIEVQVRYFNTRIPNRLEPIADSRVVALAPGEKIELEYEFQFPENALLGEYQVVIEANASEGTAEINLDNNRYTSKQAIQLSNIRLVFPDPGYTFEEAGLFLFRWESRLFDEFKVQVGVDRDFRTEELYFDIPQGAKWTQDQEIVPLGGELPGMAKGLMLSEKSDRVYWRVAGRNSETNRTAFSLVQSFTIELDEEEAAAAPMEGGGEAQDLQPLGESPPSLPPNTPGAPLPTQ